MQKIKRYFNWLRKKLKQLVNGRAFTITAKTGSASPLHQNKVTHSDYLLHRTIKTLPYENFIQVVTEGNLSPIIINGNPPPDILASAWTSIADEYADAIKNVHGKTIFDLYVKIKSTEAKILIIDSAVHYLANEYDADVANCLFEMGYHLVQNTDDRTAYLKQLETVQMQSRTLLVILNQYTNQYKILAPESELVKREYQSYIDELAILSKYQGYILKAKEITVAEYCGIANSYMTYVKSLRKANG